MNFDGFYSRSLEERRKEAARQKARYWSDPEFRLDRINRARARQGLPPYTGIEHVPHRGPLA